MKNLYLVNSSRFFSTPRKKKQVSAFALIERPMIGGGGPSCRRNIQFVISYLEAVAPWPVWSEPNKVEFHTPEVLDDRSCVSRSCRSRRTLCRYTEGIRIYEHIYIYNIICIICMGIIPSSGRPRDDYRRNRFRYFRFRPGCCWSFTSLYTRSSARPPAYQYFIHLTTFRRLNTKQVSSYYYNTAVVHFNKNIIIISI